MPHERENWAKLPAFSSDFAQATLDRMQASLDRIEESRLGFRIRRSWLKYHSRRDDGGVDETEINYSGEKAEVVNVSPNRYRRMILDQKAQVMQTPPDYEPHALNTDPESQAQSSGLVLGIMDHYRRVAHLEDHGLDRFEMGQVMSAAITHVRWDPNAGRELSVDENKEPYYEGDFVFSVRSPYEYACDPTSSDRRRPRWWVVKEPENRFDLFEQFGADTIGDDGQTVGDAIMEAEQWSNDTKQWSYGEDGYKYDDSIAVYYVYIEKNRSCPEGRVALVLDGNTVLMDGPLDEDEAGVFEYSSARVLMNAECHSNNFEGLGISEAHTAQFSTIQSNHSSYGLQRMISPRAGNVRTVVLDTGLAVIDYDHADPENPGVAVPPPSMLKLDVGPAALHTQLDVLGRELDFVMGASPVTRGDPEATKGDSGSKAAMLFAAAQTVGSAAVREHLRVEERIATFIISSLRRHAKADRVISIVGKKSTYTAKKFVGEDLKQIARVSVRNADPAQDTFQGRMAMAELMSGKTPEEREQLQALIFTGRIETMTEDVEAQRLLIERENDWLRDGGKEGDEPPKVAPTDQHLQHFKETIALMNAPEIRSDPNASKRVMDHAMAHVSALTPGHPGFAGLEVLMMTGQKPLPDPNAPPMDKDGNPIGPPPAAKMTQSPEEEANAAPPGGGPSPGNAGANEAGGMPRPVQMPVNPATGDRIEGNGPPAAV